MDRRLLLRNSALFIPFVTLAGCGIVTTTTTNGVTTTTVNVKQIQTWATAFENAATLVASLPGVPTSIATILKLVNNQINIDLAAFDTATSGKLTLTFDATSPPAALSSLLTDGNTLLTDIKGSVSNVVTTYATDAQTYLNALSTIVSLFEAALGSVGSAQPVMSESAALAALHVSVAAGVVAPPLSESAALSILHVK